MRGSGLVRADGLNSKGIMEQKKYGCHNRAPFKPSLQVQDGWQTSAGQNGEVVRLAVMKTIPFKMTTDCNYTLTELGQSDQRCAGCSWKSQAPAQALAA